MRIPADKVFELSVISKCAWLMCSRIQPYTESAYLVSSPQNTVHQWQASVTLHTRVKHKVFTLDTSADILTSSTFSLQRLHKSQPPVSPTTPSGH